MNKSQQAYYWKSEKVEIIKYSNEKEEEGHAI